ncbi:MAG: hypothetical protein K6F28_01800 [Lachnospiraceae bacterium]|nr:hypothetical protein [Lachnospiraceae bacterium]
MLKKMILVTCLMLITVLAAGSVPARADTATAKAMIPTFRAMYHVDEAEAILGQKKAVLAACKRNKASACEIGLAQLEVNYANNLLNTLNTMITRNTIMIEAAPPGVVNTPSFGANSMAANHAWITYFGQCPVVSQ